MGGMCLDDSVSDTSNVVAALLLEGGVDVGRDEVGEEFVDNRFDDAVDNVRELERDIGGEICLRRREEVALGPVEPTIEGRGAPRGVGPRLGAA